MYGLSGFCTMFVFVGQINICNNVQSLCFIHIISSWCIHKVEHNKMKRNSIYMHTQLGFR